MAITINGSGSIAGVTNLTTTGVALEDAALTDPAITGGIYIGGTGAANYLDDYEEGTFTPEFANGASSTYSSRIGTYTKIGNVVYFWLDIILSNQSGTSGGAQITGLPFTSNSFLQGVGSIGGDNNWSNPRSNLSGAVSSSSTTITIWYNSGNNLQAVQMSDLGNTGRFIIGGSYQIA
jgi:hypothetical protein